MNTNQKRQYLVALYPHSKTWPDKVKKMSDSQVVAIYLKKIRQPQERAS